MSIFNLKSRSLSHLFSRELEYKQKIKNRMISSFFYFFKSNFFVMNDVFFILGIVDHILILFKNKCDCDLDFGLNILNWHYKTWELKNLKKKLDILSFFLSNVFVMTIKEIQPKIYISITTIFKENQNIINIQVLFVLQWNENASQKIADNGLNPSC